MAPVPHAVVAHLGASGQAVALERTPNPAAEQGADAGKLVERADFKTR